MNAVGSRMKSARVWTCFCVVLALGACQVGPGKEISSTKPYADLIGARYSVVGDLYAHGVYESLNDRIVTYVTLVPIRLGGAEYAFRRIVPKGQVIKILSAWRRFVLLESGDYYLVAVENWDLPQGIPIRLDLSRGNGGAGADLNPAIYKRLPKDN